VLDFGLLGSLQRATSQGQVMPAKQRIALALLLLRANQVVSFGTLVQALWGIRRRPVPGTRRTPTSSGCVSCCARPTAYASSLVNRDTWRRSGTPSWTCTNSCGCTTLVAPRQ
jgi:hypothetical protein